MVEIKDNLYDLYASYHQHKALYEFWKKYQNIKTEEDIKNRVEYLKKNPQCKQRSELECLLWIIGEIE